MRRRLLAGAALLVATLVAAGPATAHRGGKAEPRIAAGLTRGGLERVLTVRLRDLDSGDPVSGATVAASAKMAVPHVMQTLPQKLPQAGPGLYRAPITFFMAGQWTVSIDVSGDEVVAASAQLPVRVALGSTTRPTEPGPTALPTRLDDSLTDRDYLTMAVLWVHGLAAMGWILGVLVMALALSARPGVLAESFRMQLGGWYRRWGAWLHWALVPLIVATGVYNMVYVTPFSLVWRPGDFRELSEVPYGALYEAILVVKLGLFAALLLTGTQVLARTVRPLPASATAAESGFVRTLTAALGPAGLFYLATVPLILAAAMALRYVHILSHVGEVISQR